MPDQGPVIWLLTDNKAGHRNQLRGLGNRLRVLSGASTHWLDAGAVPVSLLRALVGRSPRLPDELPPPDLVIGAGSSTHRLLLSLRRRARTVVLMKPGFPLGLVNAAILPAHDQQRGGKNLLLTEGTLNRQVPMAQLTEKRHALALIGGPSPHFQWSDDSVLSQLKTLIREHPAWHWTISDSRRTPIALSGLLAQMESLQVEVVSHRKTHEDWLSHQLAASRIAWVTPDSSSMISETVTAGVPTGLLDLPPCAGSRVARGVDGLKARGYVLPYPEADRCMENGNCNPPTLWEADRAARWLLDKGLLRRRT